MFKIRKDTKIYIISPFHNTGGPKSLHQLANVLKNAGYNVFMVYCNNLQGSIYNTNKILYQEFKINVSTSIEDNEKNILITSEYQSGIHLQYKKIQKVIWWLSLDFYLNQKTLYFAKFVIKTKNYPHIIMPLICIKIFFQKLYEEKYQQVTSKKDFKSIYHMYNCEYVHKFLKKKNVKDDNMHYLCGPLEKDYMDVDFNNMMMKKKDIVVYNPAKMNMKIFNKVQDYVHQKDSSISFVAIKNMSHDEVYETISNAKVYFDLGYFPGPERMPREAVSLYCNIITSNQGSASNNIDVPIPKQYKFAIKNSNVKKIGELIINMIKNYNKYISDFDIYRESVKNQILRFDKDILNIFKGY